MTQDIKERVEEILKSTSLFPFEIVQGDAMMRTNPHSNIRLNSTASWLVSANTKSAAKLRIGLDAFNAIPDLIKELSLREEKLASNLNSISLLEEILENTPKELSKAEGFFTHWLPNPLYQKIEASLHLAKATLKELGLEE